MTCKNALLCLALCATLSACAGNFTLGTPNDAQKCPSRLAQHAALPSETFATLPRNIPSDFRVSGKFDNPKNRRNSVLGSVDKGTTTKLPTVGQPVQGFSGVKALRDANGNPTGVYIVLTDNGYGNKFNSADSLLYFHYVKPNWRTKTVSVLKTVFFSDPNKVIPFPILNEYTTQRYLTGADLDPESIQPIGDSIFFGEEFGPYLLEAGLDGVVKAIYDISANGMDVRSPDNMLVRLPGAPTATDLAGIAFNARRSKGFEGMAASPDGKFLYPMLEGALYNKAAADYENIGGVYYWRIFKFDVEAKTFDAAFTAKYPLAAKTNSLGDFNMVDATRALVIERDDGEGDSRQSCAVANLTGCFKNPAAFKRVYLIDLSALDSNGFVQKLAYVDLLDIQDPKGVAIQGTQDGIFKFPFFTIEGVDFVSANSIIVENDNNFPSSSTRIPGKNDNNEFVILNVDNFLTGSC